MNNSNNNFVQRTTSEIRLNLRRNCIRVTDRRQTDRHTTAYDNSRTLQCTCSVTPRGFCRFSETVWNFNMKTDDKQMQKTCLFIVSMYHSVRKKICLPSTTAMLQRFQRNHLEIVCTEIIPAKLPPNDFCVMRNVFTENLLSKNYTSTN